MFPLRFFPAAALALTLACLLAGCGSAPDSQGVSQLKPVAQRRSAPDFALKDADGKPVRLSDYKGKVVLLDFWATWCGPCKLEIPGFVDLQRRNKDRGFAVLGVSMDDEGWDAVRPFVSRLGVNYRIMLGDDLTARMYGGVDALPTTFLIDREGRIAAVHVGYTEKKEFEDGVEELLQAPAPAAAAGSAGVPALFTRAE